MSTQKQTLKLTEIQKQILWSVLITHKQTQSGIMEELKLSAEAVNDNVRKLIGKNYLCEGPKKDGTEKTLEFIPSWRLD